MTLLRYGLLLFIGTCFAAKKSFIPDKCCSLGATLGSEGSDCRRAQLPVEGISDEDQKLCQSAAQFCCDRERLLLDCKLGVVFAKTYHHCLLDNSTNGCSGQAETCCTACMLAQSFGENGLECKIPGDVENEVTINLAFKNCCPQNSVPGNEDEKYYDNYEEEPTRNLCEILKGQLCTHICVPTPNSYYCQCREGFNLMEDQRTCQPDTVKPAREKNNQPPTNIVPNPEKPVPLKKPRPYIPHLPLSLKKCSEGNTCEQECLDTANGQICACRPGYELHQDRIHCKDVNECLDNIHVCDPSLEICQNEVGGYRCESRPIVSTLSTSIPTTLLERTVASTTTTTTSTTTPVPQLPEVKICLDGYTLVNNSCEDVDECDTLLHPEVCEPLEQCVNTQGSYDCRCGGGFHKVSKTGKCEDINECQLMTHQCLPEQRCDNTVGSYQCHRMAGCGTGYTLNANTGQCEDDDECLLRTDNCRYLGSQYQCRNTLGSFRCERKRCLPGDLQCSQSMCPKGYHEHPISGQCIDIDECLQKMDNCNPAAEVCVNRRGSFECRKFQTCPQGYDSSATGCVDIDECTRGTHNCGPNSECRNHIGGYTCLCLPGYQKIGSSQCEDIDECKQYGCPPSAECQNSPGSYRCNCMQGFFQAGQNYCQDEDECSTTPGLCQHHCNNVYGSFRCSCRNGFTLHENNRSCEDVDECAMFKDDMLCNGECVNTPGSFICSCPPGYNLASDGRTCQDIDECDRRPCRGHDEVCLNTRGSYACNSITCPPGYTKDVRQGNRCGLTKHCVGSVQECMQKPTTFSFNFITFVSMLPIPHSGHLDLFTLRKPPQPGTEAHFDLAFKKATAPPNIPPASREYFMLRSSGWDQAVVALRRPIPGPQEIELELTANLYRNGIYMAKVVAKLFIHVSRYKY